MKNIMGWIMILGFTLTGCDPDDDYWNATDEATKTHVVSILERLSQSNRGDLIESHDGVVLAILYCTNVSPRLVELRVSDFRSGDQFMYCGFQVAVKIKRILGPKDPDYPEMAVKFLQQE